MLKESSGSMSHVGDGGVPYNVLEIVGQDSVADRNVPEAYALKWESPNRSDANRRHIILL